jgi:hypothetical protein
MVHSSQYLQKLAEHYRALADSMRAEKDRETLAGIAAQYLQMADDAKRRETVVGRLIGERLPLSDQPRVR